MHNTYISERNLNSKYVELFFFFFFFETGTNIINLEN